jgi:hypothetical protein
MQCRVDGSSSNNEKLMPAAGGESKQPVVRRTLRYKRISRVFARPIVRCPHGVTLQSHVNGGTLQDFVVTELRFDSPRRGNRSRDLNSIGSIDELPPYIAQVVEAVAAGMQTTREFAVRQNISISNASERFRVACKLGWITRADDAYQPRKGFRYVLNNTAR